MTLNQERFTTYKTPVSCPNNPDHLWRSSHTGSRVYIVNGLPLDILVWIVDS